MKVQARTFPRFVVEGYALLDGIPYYDAIEDGTDIVQGRQPGFYERISLSPTAPEWAVVEYNEWGEMLVDK